MNPGEGRGIFQWEAQVRKKERKKEVCKRFSTPAERGGERKMRKRGEGRETVIMFSGSPLVQLLMDVSEKMNLKGNNRTSGLFAPSVAAQDCFFLFV